MGSKPTSQTNSSSSFTPPPEVVANYKAVTQQAQNVAATPYSAYGGQLVSPINQQQNTGIGAVNAASGIQNPYNATAGGLASASSGAVDPTQFSSSQIQQYESPYQSDVINATETQIQNQNQQQSAALRGNAISSGAMGGDRAGIAQAALAGQQDIANNATLANLNNQNYQQALGEFNTQQGVGLQAGQNTAARQLAASQQLGALGGQAQTEALAEANAQTNAGTLQQTTQQAQDTAAYNQFLQQQAYPFETTGWLANIVEGIGSQSGGSSTGQTTQQGNAGSQIAGGLLGLASFLARGGRVPHRATGGGLGDAIIIPQAYDPTSPNAPTGIGGGNIVPMVNLPIGHTMPTGNPNPNAAATPNAHTGGITPQSVQAAGKGLKDAYGKLTAPSDPLLIDQGGLASGEIGGGGDMANLTDLGLGGIYARGGTVLGDGGLMRRHFDDGGSAGDGGDGGGSGGGVGGPSPGGGNPGPQRLAPAPAPPVAHVAPHPLTQTPANAPGYSVFPVQMSDGSYTTSKDLTQGIAPIGFGAFARGGLVGRKHFDGGGGIDGDPESILAAAAPPDPPSGVNGAYASDISRETADVPVPPVRPADLGQEPIQTGGLAPSGGISAAGGPIAHAADGTPVATDLQGNAVAASTGIVSPTRVAGNPIEALKANISGRLESGGDYAAVGPATKGGDHGYGKFQVMGANIPSWTQEVLGQPMTSAQFLANPKAQEAVASAKLGQYYKQTGSLPDAASMWFTGRPLAAGGAGATDVNGMNGAQYAKTATAGLDDGQGGGLGSALAFDASGRRGGIGSAPAAAAIDAYAPPAGEDMPPAGIAGPSRQVSSPQYPDNSMTPESGKTGLFGLNLSPQTRQLMLSAGLGIMGGTSRSFLTNVGQGATQGIASANQNANVQSEIGLRQQQTLNAAQENRIKEIQLQRMHDILKRHQAEAEAGSSSAPSAPPPLAPTVTAPSVTAGAIPGASAPVGAPASGGIAGDTSMLSPQPISSQKPLGTPTQAKNAPQPVRDWNLNYLTKQQNDALEDAQAGVPGAKENADAFGARISHIQNGGIVPFTDGSNQAYPGFNATKAGTAGEVAGAQERARAGVELGTAGPIAGARARAEAQERANVELGTAGPIAGAKTAAEEAAKAPYEMVKVQPVPGGPTYMVPKSQVLGNPGAGSPPGSKMDAIAAQYPYVAEQPAFIAAKQEEIAKDEGSMVQQFQARQLARQRLQTLSTIMQRFQPGTFAGQKADIIASLRSVGVPVGNSDTANPEAFQEFTKNAVANVFNDVKAQGSRMLVSEIAGLTKANANPDLQPTAAAAIIGQGLGLLNYEDQHTKDYFAWKDKNPNSYSTADFEMGWVEKHPVSKFVDEATKGIGYKGQTIPPNPTDRVVGQVYQNAKGQGAKWTGTGWAPQ